MWGLLSYGNPSCGDPILCISILCGHSNPKPPACGGSHPACGNSESCIWNLLLIAFLHVELLRMAFLHVGNPAYGNPACGIPACGNPACGASKEGFPCPDDFSVQSEYNLNKKSIVLGTLRFSVKK